MGNMYGYPNSFGMDPMNPNAFDPMGYNQFALGQYGMTRPGKNDTPHNALKTMMALAMLGHMTQHPEDGARMAQMMGPGSLDKMVNEFVKDLQKQIFAAMGLPMPADAGPGGPPHRHHHHIHKRPAGHDTSEKTITVRNTHAPARNFAPNPFA